MSTEPESNTVPKTKEQIREDLRGRIVEELNKREAVTACPRCGTNEWVLAEGFYMHVQQNFGQLLELQGGGIPSVAVGCLHCGYLSFHALKILGIDLPELVQS